MPLVQVTMLITLSMLVIFGFSHILDRYDFKATALLSLPMLLGYAAILVWKPDSIILINIGVVLAAVAVGNLIGQPLRTMGSLITFAVTASLVDILSFSGGLTQRIITEYMNHQSQLLQFLCLSLSREGRAIPIIGIGDLVIMAAFSRALMQQKYTQWQSFLVPFFGLLAALIVGYAVGGIYAIPFISGSAVVFLIYQRRKFRSKVKAD